MTKRAMGAGAAGALTGALCLAVTAGAAAAQDYRPPAKRVAPHQGYVAGLKPEGATPRDAQGHPDLTGRWGGAKDASYLRYGFRGDKIVNQGPDIGIQARDAQAWNTPLYKPEHWAKINALNDGRVDDDPAFACDPAGVPRANIPGKIIQTPLEIVMVIEGNTSRYIPTDGRARDPFDSDFSTNFGLPLGHWEGDTLVVESIGFNDKTWFTYFGYFHTDQMKVVERFRREGDTLYYQFTVDDPEVLVEPWTSDTFVRHFNPNRNQRVEEEQPCEEQDVKEMPNPYYRG